MYEFVQYTTADVMIRNPVTVGPWATLADAQALFEEHGFNGMPVVDDEGRLAGFVTKMDILRAFTLRPEHIVPPYSEIMQEPVSKVMTREPITVPPDQPLTRVLQRLVEMGVKSLPVMDGDWLAGIVAREDLLDALRRATG
ncbi:CBS domain-containing protein [Aquisalimonas lutea]|uniref:CBS domain-containing protein n=1 Tax=Aquisalimonas lutea TaxID=1327750 RepID=UPI0025B40BAE|nr:CBS domain-containing protein [Aquisalimonas lutea]MDN3516007.1 CBS domain-containing protein [Aquisalimonas lutea]